MILIKRITKVALIAVFALMALVVPTISYAQGKSESVIGETMRSNGRIYVVIAVILTILIGLFLYLIRLDRKITKLEKDSVKL